MDLEEFDIWWITVQTEVEDAGFSLQDRDAHCFASAHAAGRCAYEVAREHVEEIRNPEAWT